MANDLVPQPASPKGLRTRCERGRENRTKIAGHIARLMSHFWVANEDQRVRAAQAQDWLDDMAEFHEAVVAMACRDWRQVETRRPSPAELRKLCLEMTIVPEEEKPIETSPHAFPSREDFLWLKEREGARHTLDDWQRIKAYQLAWERVQGREGADPDIWQMIDAAEQHFQQRRATAVTG